jgi:hypothetical protein
MAVSLIRYLFNSFNNVCTPSISFFFLIISTVFLPMCLLCLVLLVCERDAIPLFMQLRSRYGVSLSRDASFGDYLDRIGHVIFGLPIANDGGMLSALAGLTKGFM